MSYCWNANNRNGPSSYDESEAIAPAKTVSTRFEQTPPLVAVEHLSHPAGDTALGIVLDTIDMVSPQIRIRVLEHRDQDVQQGVRLELDLTQIGAELICSNTWINCFYFLICVFDK